MYIELEFVSVSSLLGSVPTTFTPMKRQSALLVSFYTIIRWKSLRWFSCDPVFRFGRSVL